MSKEEIIIAEKAADFMYHWMYDLGSEKMDCCNAAKEIYSYLTDGEELDCEDFFGLELDSEDLFEL